MTINDYFEYTKEHTACYGDKTLVLIQVGSFFECYALEMKMEHIMVVV